MGERIGRRIPVTIAATGITIWLPASMVFFEHRRVILPRWLYEKYKTYLHQQTQSGELSCQ